MKNEKLAKCVMWLVTGTSNQYVMNYLNKMEKESVEGESVKNENKSEAVFVQEEQ